MVVPALLLILSAWISVACTKKQDSKTIWIYTSIYKNVISELEPILKKKFPDVKFEWFQSGSENVAARVNAELASGKSQADLVMTSDPFWYAELKAAGHFLPYESPAAKSISANFKDAENAFVTVRMPVAVIAYNTTVVAKDKAPQTWKDLLAPQWKGKVSMGSPMESGTSMLLTAQLYRKEGWEFFQKMRANELLAAGGNSAVINRMETKERPIGMVLLENVLEAQKKGSPLDVVYPQEGIILVPSPIAILKKSHAPDLAKQVYDFFLSEEGQAAIVQQGRMYSLTASKPSPPGSADFSQLLPKAFEWNANVLNELYSQREEIKTKFVATVLN